MPGFTQHFYEKYCVITKSAFLYFKSKFEAYNQAAKPLAIILLNDVLSAQPVKVKLLEENQILLHHKRYKQPFEYNNTPSYPEFQFEIFLKNNDIPPQEQNVNSSEKMERKFSGHSSCDVSDNEEAVNAITSKLFVSDEEVNLFLL